ncbi:ABC transporter ATP-binding protein [Lactobacillus sp. LC28-10]|uniref:ABC transporter ATP-binding protein n=1 Tax=Secundilactobacillus angelensis TaxID=2722706 RepID=A0ABX1KYK4_9LACO|nr:ABC transporter ATP-binding protein [Secundilactobacillus angelensis]MCH5463444.1 energy-coupling factor ABC transporter ATP-binding protein [Secundilactobacillus angelensis]NLR18337.1 ABC transporter ATP-binding protein [Secundilactobacillus angelensis]
MTAIQINNLSYQYPTSDFKLSINQLNMTENLVAIAGQNGAGKSTLFKLLTGLVQLQAGEIQINQHDLAGLTPEDRLKTIGIVFQDPSSQLFNATVQQEVAWSLSQTGTDAAVVAEKVDQVLTTVGLIDSKDKNPFDLSMPEKKLLSIATVLAVDPQIYLFDEPMISLDWPSQQLVTRIMQQLAHEDHQVITITHDMDWLAATFSKVYVLTEGKVSFEGTPEAFFGESGLAQETGLLTPRIMTIAQEVLGDSRVYLTPEDYWEKKHTS